jgi:hypothetical protein
MGMRMTIASGGGETSVADVTDGRPRIILTIRPTGHDGDRSPGGDQ